MTFSIIGTGFIFPAHVEAIRTVGGKIIDIVNTAHGEDTWRDMIRTTAADCIVILVPNDLHVAMALAAADAKKIVLCEKPLALSVQDAERLVSYKNIFTVLQLHHHPLVKELRSSIRNDLQYNITMTISVFRDPSYYLSWKGNEIRSGGVLFNLGIHYFDLLSHLFGEPTQMTLTNRDEKTGSGILIGPNYSCRFHISTAAPRNAQQRCFTINGVDYNFSSQDNLSYENLHRFVYTDLMKGIGATPLEALRSIRLIETLMQLQPHENEKADQVVRQAL